MFVVCNKYPNRPGSIHTTGYPKEPYDLGARCLVGEMYPAPVSLILFTLGLKDALYLLSKAKYLAGDLKSSVSTLQHILDSIDPTDADCHLLMAQVEILKFE